MIIIDSVRFFRKNQMAPGAVTMIEVVAYNDCELDLKATFEIEATGLQEAAYSLIDAIDTILKEHLVEVSIE